MSVRLGKQEQRILTLLAETGGTNRQIAEQLGTSENTVRTQVATLLLKVGVPNRAALVAWEWKRRENATKARARARKKKEREQAGVR